MKIVLWCLEQEGTGKGLMLLKSLYKYFRCERLDGWMFVIESRQNGLMNLIEI